MRQFRDLAVVKEDVRSAVDIVSFIGKYVALTQRGERWIGFCPFHDDKNNPGFAVSPDRTYEPTGSRGVWGCWTCEARGDLFKFVQDIHGATFTEAIGIIAEVIGFDLEPYYRDLSPEERLMEERYAVVEQIADLFTEQLFKHEKPLLFFTRKGITEETLRTFKVGYCPSMSFLTTNVHADVLALIEPLSSNRSRLFGGRIVYTQFTASGRAWGWYARQPDNRAATVPKYVGTSRDAKLYDPNARLYGLAQARKLMRTTQHKMLIVEGFNDALASQQAGFPAVAACGTQLSAEQIQALTSHAIRRASVCFDGDDAGREAMFELAKRAHNLQDLDLDFVDISSEPEEFITNEGVDAFGEAVQNGLGPTDYVIARYADLDTSTPARKRDFLEHVRPFLSPYPRRSLNRNLGVQAVSRITGLSEDVIADYLDEKSDSPLMNLTGELIILAELALNPSSWVTLSDISETDFSLRRFAYTYRLMRELYEREAEVNIELLVMHAANCKAPSEVHETISRLPSVQRKNPEIFAADVRDKAARRKAVEAARDMGNQAADPRTPLGDTLARVIESVTSAMATTERKSTFSSVEAVAMTVREMERRASSDEEIAGLDLGPDWEWTSTMLNGLLPRRIICVAAASGEGKSMVSLNWAHRLSVCEDYGTRPDGDGIARTVAAPRAAGLIVSLEMTVEENLMRLAAIESGVPHFYIEHSRYASSEQEDLVIAAMERIQSARVTWMTGHQSVRSIALEARLCQARGDLDYIVIDYIQRLDLSPYSNRMSDKEKYDAISQEVKDLSESLNVPIIVVAQLNRDAMREDVPTGANIGSSLKIYQDAHAFFILAPRENGIIGVLDKNRSGGEGAVKLGFDRNPQTSSLRIRELEVLKHNPGR